MENTTGLLDSKKPMPSTTSPPAAAPSNDSSHRVTETSPASAATPGSPPIPTGDFRDLGGRVIVTTDLSIAAALIRSDLKFKPQAQALDAIRNFDQPRRIQPEKTIEPKRKQLIEEDSPEAGGARARVPVHDLTTRSRAAVEVSDPVGDHIEQTFQRAFTGQTSKLQVTKENLQSIRQPKSDWMIGSTVVRKKSKSYKDILQKLQEYHACKTSDFVKAWKLLVELQSSLGTYQAKLRGWHRYPEEFIAAIEQLLSQVGDELKLIRSKVKLHGEVRIKPQEIPGVLHFFADYFFIREIWQKKKDGQNASQCVKNYLLEKYNDLALVRNPKTMVQDLTQAAASDDKDQSHGALNQVSHINYFLPDPHRPGQKQRVEKVFKPIQKVDGKQELQVGFLDTSGVKRTYPHIANRNLATYAIDQMLGFNVIPKTEIGMNRQGELGIVMDKAEGQPSIGWPGAIFDSEKVRCQLVRLQLLDALTAQSDRHPKNYFVASNGSVTGIDNDQSFGAEIDDPQKIVEGSGGPLNDPHRRIGYRGVLLPRVIDKEMLATINALSPERLEQATAGLLTDEELEALKKRFEVIKGHVNDPEQCLIIEKTAWESPIATEKLFEYEDDHLNHDGYTSYVARDRHCLMFPGDRQILRELRSQLIDKNLPREEYNRIKGEEEIHMLKFRIKRFKNHPSESFKQTQLFKEKLDKLQGWLKREEERFRQLADDGKFAATAAATAPTQSVRTRMVSKHKK